MAAEGLTKDRLWRLIDDEHVWLDKQASTGKAGAQCGSSLFREQAPTERALRGPVVGRRNHFGSKSERGTEAASIIYSLVESAKLNGVDPERYLRTVVVAAQADATAVVMPWDLASSDA